MIPSTHSFFFLIESRKALQGSEATYGYQVVEIPFIIDRISVSRILSSSIVSMLILSEPIVRIKASSSYANPMTRVISRITISYFLYKPTLSGRLTHHTSLLPEPKRSFSTMDKNFRKWKWAMRSKVRFPLFLASLPITSTPLANEVRPFAMMDLLGNP